MGDISRLVLSFPQIEWEINSFSSSRARISKIQQQFLTLPWFPKHCGAKIKKHWRMSTATYYRSSSVWFYASYAFAFVSDKKESAGTLPSRELLHPAEWEICGEPAKFCILDSERIRDTTRETLTRHLAADQTWCLWEHLQGTAGNWELWEDQDCGIESLAR